MTLATHLERAWWQPSAGLIAALLLPVAALFGTLAALRRRLYANGWLASVRLPVPVIVVGNLAVGGTGKTPLTRALAEALRERGFRPGIVSRGYGRCERAVHEVTGASTWREAGDEPLVLARGGAPVFVAATRAAAATALLAAHRDVDVILSDDGLQHYALARDFEIAVVDARRGLGNGRLLPAGPLREPAARLAEVDAIVEREPGPPDAAAAQRDRHGAAAEGDWRGAAGGVTRYAMRYESEPWRNLVDATARLDPASLAAGDAVAIAAIADPGAFFARVAQEGFVARVRAFPDHYVFRREDVVFPGARAILMTEKDAVKCREFTDARMWLLPIRAEVDPALVDAIVEKLRGPEAARNAGLSGDQGSADS
ncbi:MAG TPA: tetraacyldisaccharide 4'-kinase [Casimicrobiaceae bacterium]